MAIWLSKPVYMLLPYFYAAAGLAFLAAARYLDDWYWPAIGTVAGVGCLAGAAWTWWRRH